MATAVEPAQYQGTGKRKTSVARVRLAAGSGKITVNTREFEIYNRHHAFKLELRASHQIERLDSLD